MDVHEEWIAGCFKRKLKIRGIFDNIGKYTDMEVIDMQYCSNVSYLGGYLTKIIGTLEKLRDTLLPN
ncbi:MAG: hypothetical protein KAU17_08255 [Spirochaetales bacterium]|nr:hypothetical protein [Spirochaetales bacterium]